MTGMIMHLEVLLDQMGHSLTRPQPSFITEVFGTLQEQLDQTSFVGLIQAGQPSRSTRLAERNVASLLVFLSPTADGLIADLQPPPDLAVVKVFVEQFHGLEATLLECHEITLYTPRIAHAGIDARRRDKVPLYYAGFSSLVFTNPGRGAFAKTTMRGNKKLRLP